MKHVNIDEIVWRESESKNNWDGKWEPVECWDNVDVKRCADVLKS